jgi:hypothetical protein
MSRIFATVLMACLCAFSTPIRAAECDEVIARHMVGQAMLAAHFVAVAEKGGMTAAQINAVLRDIAAHSAIEEFWITDGAGHAYLTNTGMDFTFSRDPAKQPQASAFWALIDGSKKIVVQEAKAGDRRQGVQVRRRRWSGQAAHCSGWSERTASACLQVKRRAADLPRVKQPLLVVAAEYRSASPRSLPPTWWSSRP